jgi:hypothetical protein
VDQTFCTYIKKLMVVAAVSYQTYSNPTNALATDVFISLMGVASSAVPHPKLIHSWRRNGIGIFLFVQIIKRCASTKSNAKQSPSFCSSSQNLGMLEEKILVFQQTRIGPSRRLCLRHHTSNTKSMRRWILDGSNHVSFGILALSPTDHDMRPQRKGFLGF